MSIINKLKKYIDNDLINDIKIFKLIEDNIDEIIDNINNKKLLDIIINFAKERYFNNKPVLTDHAYDKLLNKLSILDPNNKNLSDIGFKVNSIKKMKLPYHMGSMNKIVKKYNNEDNNDIIDKLNKWTNTYLGPYLISDKLDGISCMLIINSDNNLNLLTRGDGTIGSDISHIIKYINIRNIDNIKRYIINNNLKRIILRGELIMEYDKFFKKYYKNDKETISNPRNYVSGKIIAKEINKFVLSDIDLIFYEIIEPWFTIKIQFDLLIKLELNIVRYNIVNKITIDILSNILNKQKNDIIYDIDGIIISDINYHKRNTINNPLYSFAFKETLKSNIVDAIVETVEWNVSKDGYIKPRIKITPIILSGVKISYVTAHNAKYIYDNNIGPGTIIKITRSGDVIPYIVNIVKKSSFPEMPSTTIEWIWNKTNVDIILKKFNYLQLIKILVHFSKKLNIKNIDKGIFKKLVENNIITSLIDIFFLKKTDLIDLDGFGNKKINNIFIELNNAFNNMHLINLMCASNIFGRGIGFKKIKKILDIYPDIILQTYKNNNILIEMINKIDGIDNITSTQFVNKLDEFINFFNKLPIIIKNRLLLDTIPKKKIIKNIFNNFKVVFTGFRNNEWKKIIEDNGGEVNNNISNNTNILVYDNLDQINNKIKKAKELNTKMLSKKEFINYIKKIYNIII
jgi:NAD-dependent DNA ligase